jgi:hypothetical protein
MKASGTLAAMATGATGHGRTRQNGISNFGYLSPAMLHNPPGSTPAHVRADRRARRKAKMRLRARRGRW